MQPLGLLKFTDSTWIQIHVKVLLRSKQTIRKELGVARFPPFAFKFGCPAVQPSLAVLTYF